MRRLVPASVKVHAHEPPAVQNKKGQRHGAAYVFSHNATTGQYEVLTHDGKGCGVSGHDEEGMAIGHGPVSISNHYTI
jgi:hypothetical protein